MTEAEIKENLRPHGNVKKILHPLRGSEDDLEYTREQRSAIQNFADFHDEVRHKRLPDGRVSLETIDYDDGGQQIECHVIYPDGTPF